MEGQSSTSDRNEMVISSIPQAHENLLSWFCDDRFNVNYARFKSVCC